MLRRCNPRRSSFDPLGSGAPPAPRPRGHDEEGRTVATEIKPDERARQFAAAEHPMLIGADWVEAADGRTFDVYDPSTGDVLGRVARGGSEDIDRAVKTARAAFDSGPWPTMTASERGRVIHRLGDLVLGAGDEVGAPGGRGNRQP